MNRKQTVIALGLALVLAVGCTSPQIINSNPEQDKIQIVGEIERAVPTPTAETARLHADR